MKKKIKEEVLKHHKEGQGCPRTYTCERCIDLAISKTAKAIFDELKKDFKLLIESEDYEDFIEIVNNREKKWV